MKRQSGFTLIELLVVIAIIAILAAILFPVMGAVRMRAKQSVCASNLKQISLATQMYMGDYKDRFPMWGGGDVTTGWLGAVQKYARTKLLSKCPGLPKQASGFSYWRNVYTDRWSPNSGVPPPTLSEMVYTKTTVFLMCGPADSNDVGWHTYWGPPTTWGGLSKAVEEEAETRHLGGANVVFVDGHVQLVKKGGFKSTFLNTGADNPLKGNPAAGWYGYPSPPWDNKNDGSHPWFRNN